MLIALSLNFDFEPICKLNTELFFLRSSHHSVTNLLQGGLSPLVRPEREQEQEISLMTDYFETTTIAHISYLGSIYALYGVLF